MPNSRFLDDLPETLAYLKQPAKDIAAQNVELLGCGEADLTTFDNAVRGEMAGLSTAEAEIRCAQHQQLLQDWLSRRESQTDPYILALNFLVGPLAAAYDVVSPCDDDDDFLAPTFRPRMAQLEHPEQFSTNRRANDTVVTDGSTELLIREIDERSYLNLTEEFSRPRRKTTTPDGETVYPQSNISLGKATGTKNVVENKNEQLRKQVTYFLRLKDGFVMVRLMAPDIDTDETVIEAMLDSITFT
jgi:hypothetical protein